MSIADGIEDIKTFERVPSLIGGSDGKWNTYRLRVIKLETGVTQLARADFFRGRFEVVTSEGEGANPVGTDAEVFIPKRAFDFHLKEIAALVGAVVNDPQTKVTARAIAEITASDQPAKGEEALVRVRNKGGFYKNGDPILELVWLPIFHSAVTAPPTTSTAKAKGKG